MLDINLLRRDLDGVVAQLQRRKSPQPFLDVARYGALEAERKAIQTQTEQLQARRNALSREIGKLKGQGGDASARTGRGASNPGPPSKKTSSGRSWPSGSGHWDSSASTSSRPTTSAPGGGWRRCAAMRHPLAGWREQPPGCPSCADSRTTST